jgi:hypothetical protein
MVGGAAELDPMILVGFTDGFLPSAGEQFDLITASEIIFHGDLERRLFLPESVDGFLSIVDVDSGAAGMQQVLRLTITSVVPEPSSLALAASLCALFAIRRCRRPLVRPSLQMNYTVANGRTLCPAC